MNKKNIAVIYGGDSSEVVISMKSAKMVMQSIDFMKYNVYGVLIRGTDWMIKLDDDTNIGIDKNDFSFTKNEQKVNFDCVVIIIHGSPGENGLLQSYFELIGMPYTTCNAFVSALTFDKYACKAYLRDLDLHMAKGILVKKNQKIDTTEILEELGLPVFVKPNAAGSSFGITKVKSAGELEKALESAFTEDNEVLIEEFIKGIELSHGIMKTREGELLLPVTEIVSKKEFFDFEAKYTAGMSDEITPARIDGDTAARVQQLSSKIYNWLSCRGIVRLDYILCDNELYFLEINTVPGMSEASIVPKQIQFAGLSFTQVLTMLIEDTLYK
ncbi:MAG: D-alanine--D-alanine ligase [Prevotellaceae bacterium]|jgi:D-alanine-D-alanine ligase|nr:D-alanine--D-alanine ligase [Prevotellaceae bacterium]